MADILKIIAILYMILLVPAIFGVLWNTYMRKKSFTAESFVRGWTCMMGLFYCEAVPVILWKMSLSSLKYIWLITVVVITVLIIFGLIKGKLEVNKWGLRKNWGYMLISGMLILCSILFFKPDVNDDTVETVMEAYGTDTMYQYQPFTDDKYETIPEKKAYAPLEMYYAVLSGLVGAHPAIVVKILIPFAFLSVFILVYVMWAKILFQKNAKFRKIFLFFVGCIYFLPVISRNMELMAVWRNCWKGEVLLGTTILPLVCYDVYGMMISLLNQWSRKKCIRYAVNLTITVITAQLAYIKGMAFSSIIIIAGTLIIIARRFCDKYVASAKEH